MKCWLGTWAASPAAPVYFVPQEIMATPTPLAGTLRHRLRLSAGGTRLQLRFSNETGDQALRIGSATIGLPDGNGGMTADTLQRVTFARQSGIVIPPGSPVLSDQLDLAVAPLGEVVVSVFFPEEFTPARSEGVHKAQHVPAADCVMDLVLPPALRIAVRPTVTAIAVEVETGRSPGAIVCLGDSLTDGAGAQSAEFRSWTDILARRLRERDGANAQAVVNAGIGGNQLIGALIGPPALARLDRDVFATPGITHLVVFEGINDIGAGGRTNIEGITWPLATTAGLIAGYQQILVRARARGVKVIGSTLLPFAGSLFFLDEKEVVRQEVNHWIRTSGVFEQVIDFEAALRDPKDPSRLAAEFDSGDCMHPNTAGQRALGAAVNLGLFK
ncbi:MAG: SGNH/GDSL hydrolase family protein [Proteobacteria bacterium]|nr:SGNH/GDSL hydrolase family protein [Pseudomonadota bacterium]